MTVPDRPTLSVPFSDEALRTTLERLEGEWDEFQSARDRDAIYSYLTALFEVVAWWMQDRKTTEYARRALQINGRPVAPKSPEPFAALILCTADGDKADYRTRSKWSRVLRYTAEFKRSDESLTAFIKRKGGINKCAIRFSLRLGRSSQYRGAASIFKAAAFQKRD
jgi:hypothetical protein